MSIKKAGGKYISFQEFDMAKRMITTEVLEEDKKIEGSLRPKTLNEYR